MEEICITNVTIQFLRLRNHDEKVGRNQIKNIKKCDKISCNLTSNNTSRERERERERQIKIS